MQLLPLAAGLHHIAFANITFANAEDKYVLHSAVYRLVLQRLFVADFFGEIDGIFFVYSRVSCPWIHSKHLYPTFASTAASAASDVAGQRKRIGHSFSRPN
jgi:hypothetical protein